MRNPAKTRTCAGCGKKADKSDFLRIGKGADGAVSVSESGGRGAYICKNRSCLELAIKKKRFSMILKAPVGQELFNRLHDMLGSDSD